METRGGKRMGAGRKKGVKNPATLEKQRVLAAYQQRIMACADELFEAQMKLARRGNNAAIESMLNRAFGKSTENIDVKGSNENFWDWFMANKKDNPLVKEENCRA